MTTEGGKLTSLDPLITVDGLSSSKTECAVFDLVYSVTLRSYPGELYTPSLCPVCAALWTSYLPGV